MIPDFEVTILGNTSSIPVHGRNPTAQVVRYHKDYFLIDCGEGTQIQLQRFKVKSSRIENIFISHLHGDHYLGLVGLLSSYNLNGRTKPLTIFGPKGLDEIITTQFRWSNTRLGYPLEFIQTNPHHSEVILEKQGVKVISFPMKHRLPTTGFKVLEKERKRRLIKEKLEEANPPIEAIKAFREGKDYSSDSGKTYLVDDFAYPEPKLRSYAFCSDTIYDEGLVPYLQDMSLLYHESTFMDDQQERAKITYHSTAREAAKIAKMANVGELLLGHFSSRYNDLSEMLVEAKSEFEKSILSEQGQTYSIS
ncbi:ribonuclease Z [Algoriphagus sediminis]|uniref:Ribonuclease Z n=1 Tax=Algoriphagus sediminis TaxID=3057113 RepID=A0ABT7YB74_9BACT|nr:ribonuclease Z [Algoriphagus sediminis]MDN3203444.1 ribonuclease Z [Algoriphagus sediminis]